jgi:hypothetical protein
MRPLRVVAGLLLTACSRGSSPTGPAPASSASTSPPAADAKFAHPCSILQRSDAEAILGTGDLHEEEQPGPPGDARCAWSAIARRGMVELRVQFPARKEGFDRNVPDRMSIPGIGDKAYLQKRMNWGHVDVLKGERTFFVQVERSRIGVNGGADDPDKLRADTVALARTLAPRI